MDWNSATVTCQDLWPILLQPQTISFPVARRYSPNITNHCQIQYETPKFNHHRQMFTWTAWYNLQQNYVLQTEELAIPAFMTVFSSLILSQCDRPVTKHKTRNFPIKTSCFLLQIQKKTIFTYKNNLFGVRLAKWAYEHNSEHNKSYLHNGQFSSVHKNGTGRPTMTCQY